MTHGAAHAQPQRERGLYVIEVLVSEVMNEMTCRVFVLSLRRPVLLICIMEFTRRQIRTSQVPPRRFHSLMLGTHSVSVVAAEHQPAEAHRQGSCWAAWRPAAPPGGRGGPVPSVLARRAALSSPSASAVLVLLLSCLDASCSRPTRARRRHRIRCSRPQRPVTYHKSSSCCAQALM